MFFLLFLLGFVAAAIYGGIHSAEQTEPQWPKVLWIFAGLLVLIGLAAAWMFTLPWDLRAAISWPLVMFGPFLVLAMAFGLISSIAEIVARHRYRRRAEREAGSQ